MDALASRTAHGSKTKLPNTRHPYVLVVADLMLKDMGTAHFSKRVRTVSDLTTLRGHVKALCMTAMSFDLEADAFVRLRFGYHNPLEPGKEDASPSRGDYLAETRASDDFPLAGEPATIAKSIDSAFDTEREFYARFLKDVEEQINDVRESVLRA